MEWYRSTPTFRPFLHPGHLPDFRRCEMASSLRRIRWTITSSFGPCTDPTAKPEKGLTRRLLGMFPYPGYPGSQFVSRISCWNLQLWVTVREHPKMPQRYLFALGAFPIQLRAAEDCQGDISFVKLAQDWKLVIQSSLFAKLGTLVTMNLGFGFELLLCQEQL